MNRQPDRKPRRMSGGRRENHPIGYYDEREATMEKADFDDVMKIHPHNFDAEAVLLGAIMIENKLLERAVERGLTYEHFWEPTHARIFDRIQMLAAQGRGANPVTLRPFFDGETFTVPGEYGSPDVEHSIGRYIAGLTGNPAALIGAMSFVDQIMDLAALRAVIQVARDIAESSTDRAGDMDPRRVLQEAEVALTEVGASMPEPVKTGMMWEDAFEETLEDAERINDGSLVKGIKIRGYDDWNDVAGAMEPADYMLLGGRPGMGKTGVACAVAAGSAMAGHGTDFLSLEMEREQISRRILANVMFVEGETSRFDEIKEGRFTRADRVAIGNARTAIKGKPLFIDSPLDFYIEDFAGWLKKRSRFWKAKGVKHGLVVVDYLDKFVTRKDFGPNETARVSYISRMIKTALKAAGVAGLILCQLSRAVDEREDKHPTLRDLRQSGSLEQDADGVFFVYRGQYYLQRSKPDDRNEKKLAAWNDDMAADRDRLELYAAKRREGGLTKRTGYFFEDYQAVRSSTFYRHGSGGYEFDFAGRDMDNESSSGP